MSRRENPAARIALLLLLASCGPLDLGGEGDLAVPAPVDATATPADASASDASALAGDLSRPPDLTAADDLVEAPRDLNCPGRLSVAPPAVALGKVPAGQPSTPVMLMLANGSGCFVILRAGRIVGPDAPAFDVDPLKYPWPMPPGHTQLVGVRLNAAAGSYTASLEFETDSLAQPMIAIRLDGTAVNGFPRIGTDVAMITFGPQVVGAMSNPQPVVITNGGPADLHIAQVNLGGAMPGDFVLDTAMLQRTVAMGASTSIRAAFRPLAAGQRSAQIVIDSDDGANPRLVLPLTGQGQ